MFLRCSGALRWIAIALLVTLFAPTLISKLSTSAQNRTGARLKATAHTGEGKKKGLSRPELEREAEIWHELNRRRLIESDARGAEALTADFINQDINDISVIQDDGRVIIPANAFDLTGRAVQFTPSGAGYTITNGAGTYDSNFGTKLNLTTAPAVNPGTAPEPGDDAYILQDLGFNFNFFGTSFSSVAISSNGNLTFRPGGVSQGDFDAGAVNSGESVASFQQGLPRIAPYWHDLDARAAQTTGASGVYIRKTATNVLITWNNIRDYPNDPSVDNGFHRFQVTLFNDGRITFTYDLVQLTSTGLAGITPGNAPSAPTLTNLLSPPASVFTSPVGEFFSKNVIVDIIGAAQAFYITHPNRDVYDFIYFITDFDFDLGGGAFAFYLPLRNDIAGIGLQVGQSSAVDDINSQKIQGILNLSNIATEYPASPVTRFLGANHAFSVMGQEQGHRWLAYVGFPGGNDTLLLGRDDAHWSFFLNIPSTISSPAAPRSSSAEGNVWRDNGNGTFTSVNLIDGYSVLDQYLMGLRSNDVPATFVITNPSGTSATRESNPRPNVTVTGTKQNVSIGEILTANGERFPNFTNAPKNFRAAVVLMTRQGTQPSQATLDKITLYRLGWESYFAQSTDFLASINTGLADQNILTSRIIATASAASFKSTLAQGELATIFGPGGGLTSGGTATATSQPLPTILAGAQVRVNGAFAPLVFASPSQINFEVPRNTVATTSFPTAVQSSTALVEVLKDGQLIRVGTFQIAPVVPAIFSIGAGNAAAIDAFTGALQPFNAKQANGQPNIISVFGTGIGADATDVDGNLNASVQALIDGAPATVLYAGRAPGFTGLNQLNIAFPANIAPAAHTLVISRNGILSNQVTFDIKQ
jgi:uncharacterized protein (TIGR03437 family)